MEKPKNMKFVSRKTFPLPQCNDLSQVNSQETEIGFDWHVCSLAIKLNNSVTWRGDTREIPPLEYNFKLCNAERCINVYFEINDHEICYPEIYLWYPQERIGLSPHFLEFNSTIGVLYILILCWSNVSTTLHLQIGQEYPLK